MPRSTKRIASKSTEHVDSLSNFTTDPGRYLKRLRQQGKPMLLTVEGELGVVIQDAVSYQQLLESMDRLETIAALKEGLRDVAAGRTRPMREVLKELAEKHHLASRPDE